MAHSGKKRSASSFVVIPLGPHASPAAEGPSRSTPSPLSVKAAAVELILRLRFTIDVEVESTEARDAR
jgi:hypothetical protein